MGVSAAGFTRADFWFCIRLSAGAVPASSGKLMRPQAGVGRLKPAPPGGHWQAEAQCHLGFPVGGVLHLLWGRQSCLQPPFRRLFRATGIFPPGKSRLKAGCSQDLAAPQFVQNGLRSKTSLPHHWAIQVWWALLDLNPRPTDYESAAL